MKIHSKKKILFLMQLPPPVHGASMVNLSIKQSALINAYFDSKALNISPAVDMSDLGKVSLYKIFLTFKITFSCLKSFLSFSPNLVYLTLSPHGAAFWKDSLIVLLLKLFGAKFVFHLHGKGIRTEIRNSFFKRWFYTFVFKNVDVIHLSKSLFFDIEDVFDKKKTLFAVNNGVCCNSASFSIRPKNVIRLLYLSNLVPAKGADTLIDAINMLPSTYIGKFRLDLVGKLTDENFYNQLVSQVDARFSSSVNFLGPLYGKDKFDIFASSDVFILPTRYKNECFPLSILEAMSFSMPVISTFEGAIPDIVDDGVCGFVIESDNPELLAKKIMFYIDSPEEISLHGESARKKYETNYTIDAFERSLIKSIDFCVGS